MESVITTLTPLQQQTKAPGVMSFNNICLLSGKLLHTSYSEAHAPGLHLLKEKFYSLLKIERHSMFGKLAVLGPDDELNIKVCIYN